MVCAQPRDARRITPRLDQALGHLLEERVAGLPSQGIVDRLEALQVEDQQREPVLLALGGVQELSEVFLEKRPVGESRELVVVGHIVELRRFRDVLERERDVARQLVEQPHFLFVEEPNLLGIDRENALSPPADDERQGHHRTETAGERRGIGGNARIGGDVVHDSRLPLAHHERDHPRPLCLEPQNRRDTLQVVCRIFACPRHRLDLHVVIRCGPDPRHREFPVFHDDAAGLLE